MAMIAARVLFDGQATYYRDEVGVLLFVVSPSGIYDHRKCAPFPQVLPCPYCGVESDAGHDPIKHTVSAIVVYP